MILSGKMTASQLPLVSSRMVEDKPGPWNQTDRRVSLGKWLTLV